MSQYSWDAVCLILGVLLYWYIVVKLDAGVVVSDKILQYVQEHYLKD